MKVPARRWEGRCAPGWDRWSPEEVRGLQDRELSRFITGQVYPNHPYYRRLFDEGGIDPESIKSVDDLVKVPFTCKEDIAPREGHEDNPRRFLLAPGGPAANERAGWVPVVGTDQALAEEYQPVATMFTTGTSAEPTPFFFTRHDLARMREAGRRLASVIASNCAPEVDLRVSMVNNFPAGPHLAYWVALGTAEGAAVTMVSTGVGSMGIERVLNIVERMRPTVFMGLPGYTYDLFKRANAERRDLSSIEVVVMGGDRVTRYAREKVTGMLEEMGAVEPVVTGAFGATEMKYAWGDCGDVESTGYHTCPDMEVVEVVDPESGRVLGDGETGELVVTNLDARGSVVLRYRTGDILEGGITRERCPCCGRTMPRVSAKIHRGEAAREFALAKVKGNLVDLNAFSAVLGGNVEVLEWAVELRKRNDDPADIDQLWVFVCPTSIGEEGGLEGRVAEGVRTALDITPDRVVVAGYDEVAERLGPGGGARRRVIDLRPA